MESKKPHLYLFFFLAMIFFFINAFFFPSFKLVYLAPFLVIVFSRLSFLQSLWISSLCGLSIDLITSALPLGSHALIYTFITVIIYRHKWHFFVDKPIGFFSYTILFSLLSTIFHFLFLSFFNRSFPLNIKSLISDFIIMPFFDGIYALLWFHFSLILYIYAKQKGFHIIHQKLYASKMKNWIK